MFFTISIWDRIIIMTGIPRPSAFLSRKQQQQQQQQQTINMKGHTRLHMVKNWLECRTYFSLFHKALLEKYITRVSHTILHPTYYPRLFITPLNDERAQVAFGHLTKPLENYQVVLPYFLNILFPKEDWWVVKVVCLNHTMRTNLPKTLDQLIFSKFY